MSYRVHIFVAVLNESETRLDFAISSGSSTIYLAIFSNHTDERQTQLIDSILHPNSKQWQFVDLQCEHFT